LQVSEEQRPSAALARLLAAAERHAQQVGGSVLGPAPLTGMVILTCMDARIMVEEIFGLRPGDANVMRNAGAVASDDFIRSLVLSQRVLGSREVVVVGHTGCGLYRLPEGPLLDDMARQTGHRQQMRLGAFDDLDDHVRQQVALIRQHPWVRAVPVHGLVYEVESGRLRNVE
jgi:carbonic anhydrase